MSSDNVQRKEVSELSPNEARDALAEALDVAVEPIEPPEGAEEGGETDLQDQASDDHDVVVALSADAAEVDLDDLDENPFAAAAEFASHVRMTEALLFAAAEPLDEKTIKSRLPDNAKVKDCLEGLQQQYENRGVHLKKIGKKWAFVTSPEVAHVLVKDQIQPKKLSRAALETLSIIAYHQPCTRNDIEEVRGVAVSKGSIDLLMEINWIKLRGRREDVPGRPLLYGTTEEFLEQFGLENISHLPGMADLKAAGLLDARLPPDFAVPTPSSENGTDDGSNDPEETEFVQEFTEADEAEVRAGLDDMILEEDEAADQDET